MSLDLNKTVLPNSFLKCMSSKDRPKGPAFMTATEAQSKFDEKSEKKLQKLIANWLLLNGFYFVQQRMDRKAGLKVGTPDFLICVHGRFVAVECKVAKNRPTAEQADCLTTIRRTGGISHVIYELKEFIDIIQSIQPSIEEVKTLLEK